MKINNLIKFVNNAHSNPITIDVRKIANKSYTDSRGRTTTIGEMDLVHILRKLDKLQSYVNQIREEI